MNHYWWCGLCDTVAVSRSGDICLRCSAEIDAVIEPNQRQPLAMAPPWGVRFLNWISGRTTA